MKGRHRLDILLFFFFCLLAQAGTAQMGFSLDIDKPKPFENRELRAEKTGDKKLKLHKRIFQNSFTHYNYFFNANNKLNEVLDRAKSVHKDDYSNLLPFYNYELKITAGDKAELDSVIYKAKTGIVLHDLRNDWIDDLYLLWGTAFYLQEEYDSAYQMFQFINYAFADKEDDGYYRYIGSRMDGNTTGTIITKEDFSFPKGMIADPPSRNNALVWQVRTLIQSGAMAEASSLLALLKTDPNFPDRLDPVLEEVQAYMYYVQQRWDSAAAHLSLALDAAGTKQEKARWEYLIGQLHEKSGALPTATEYYNKAIAHTTDPVMDIYARLNLIRINKEGGDAYIEQNIAELMKMARRDKYVDYRDVIYYMAAQMELERANFTKAQEYFLKAAEYKSGNLPPTRQGFLHLADLYYNQKEYLQAARFYDSVQIEEFPTEEAERISERKEMLGRLANQAYVVLRQDSLQRIATLPEKEREEYIKKLVRQLRRQQGLREEGTTPVIAPLTAAALTDLFGTTNKGEWYFYNAKIKSQGAAAFKQQWGPRPNADNWRRSGNVVAQMRNEQPNNTRGNPLTPGADVELALTYDGLLANLPTTEAQLQVSNDSIVSALYMLGRMYINDIEDYEAAVKTYEELRRRFPAFEPKDEVLFQLYYAYTKLGNSAKAAEMKNGLNTLNTASRYASIINNGTDPESTLSTAAATKAYEGVYDLYIEGRFAEAQRAKTVADSLYNTTFWSPQLLYIQSVYHIRQQEDSVAKGILNILIAQAAGTPMAEKAATLLDVLNRRAEIEAELAALQIERPVEEKVVITPLPKPPVKEVEKEVAKVEEKKEEVKQEEEQVAVTRTQQIQKNDASTGNKQAGINNNAPKKGVDTIATKALPQPQAANVYTYTPHTKYYTVVILNKVDVVYGNEAKNALARYHREKYYNEPLQTTLQQFDEDNKLLIVGDFVNVQAAIDYLQNAKAIAATQIMPWLKPEKYMFTLISEANLKLLQEKKDLVEYQRFLDQNLPVKF